MLKIYTLRRILATLLVFLLQFLANVSGIGEVIYAVNCGGDAHTDSHGIRYQKDTNVQGIASDYGRSMLIQRVSQQDQIIYQTERYALANFYYEVPIKSDGSYVLWLKFSEVWFAQPNQKVFNVVLNDDHVVVDSLDIFHRAGRGIAHDEYVPFTIKNNQLIAGGVQSAFPSDRKLKIEFAKLDKDNPKVNGLIIMKGTIEEVPKLPPLPGRQETMAEEEEEEEDESEDSSKKNAQKKRPVSSGPKVEDPYASDDTGSMMLPVLVAIGAFVPLLFCLCRL